MELLIPCFKFHACEGVQNVSTCYKMSIHCYFQSHWSEERGLLDPTLQPRVLKHMTLQLPGHSGWVLAEEAALTRFPNKGAERKVWLHLKRFRPEKSPRGPSDGDIFPSTLRSRQSRQTDGQGTENAVATGENAREV